VGWLACGIVYSVIYALIGTQLRDHTDALSWFRAAALIVPPLTGATVIVRRRSAWRGCQWLFWATIAVGLVMSAIGLSGWAADELMLARETWLAWPAVFALFGGVAPLFALLAQPHRGPREPLTATTAVDIAGLTVVTGFLYSFFVTTNDSPVGADSASMSLILVSELQQALVAAAMLAATAVARRTAWTVPYRRLALGALVGFATLTISNFEILQGAYRSAFVYDFTWILPFAFFPWAIAAAPPSDQRSNTDEGAELVRPRPWVIFTAVAMIPFLDFGLRHVLPVDASKGVRDLSTAVTIISVLPLLIARVAAERAEMQQAGSTVRLMGQVIEQAGDLIVVFTPDGACRHANEAFCRATGYTREELDGVHPMALIDDAGSTASEIEACAREDGMWRGLVTRRRKDGTVFPSSATVAAVFDDNRRLTHIVSVERDVSEDRLLRKQLIHSERLSAVGQLVSGVAHELNNPLQSVIGLTELLMATQHDEQPRRDLERIRADAHRAAKIVRNLLTFVRRSPIDRSLIDLNEAIRSTVSLRSFELRTLNITLLEDYDARLPLVSANREEIQQVVLNLLVNAEHALRSNGGGTIRVGTRHTADTVIAEVSDDGPGVPPESAGRIFEPFYTTKAVGEGTGLGLSISLGIAEAHGGSLILAASERGACFRLTLPVHVPAAHQAPRRVAGELTRATRG
jgi:PAS domain S-box-containing protein